VLFVKLSICKRTPKISPWIHKIETSSSGRGWHFADICENYARDGWVWVIQLLQNRNPNIYYLHKCKQLNFLVLRFQEYMELVLLIIEAWMWAYHKTWGLFLALIAILHRLPWCPRKIIYVPIWWCLLQFYDHGVRCLSNHWWLQSDHGCNFFSFAVV